MKRRASWTPARSVKRSYKTQNRCGWPPILMAGSHLRDCSRPDSEAAMDRSACIAKAAACREKAQADPVHRDHWIEQTIDWLERAMQETGRVSMTDQTEGGRLVR